MTTKQREAIIRHGQQLLAIFPNTKIGDPLTLCRRLRKIEAEGAKLAKQLCSDSTMDEGKADAIGEDILRRVNALLGNVRDYQPKTGAKCTCRKGIQRDNCPACEGTGYIIDFRAIRNAPKTVLVFLNRDPRGYALKIDSEYVRAHSLAIHRDWGGYGIIAPEIGPDGL